MKELTMPILRPLPIQTKGLEWYQKYWAWLTATRKWEVVMDYEVYIEHLDITVKIPGGSIYEPVKKTGFIFDGASIPRLFRNVLAPTGILFIPGLVHDFGYKFRFLLLPDNTKVHVGESQKFFDKVFEEMSLQINGIKGPSFVAYGSLRGAGFMAWNKHRKADVKFDEVYPDCVVDQEAA